MKFMHTCNMLLSSDSSSSVCSQLFMKMKIMPHFEGGCNKHLSGCMTIPVKNVVIYIFDKCQCSCPVQIVRLRFRKNVAFEFPLLPPPCPSFFNLFSSPESWCVDVVQVVKVPLSDSSSYVQLYSFHFQILCCIVVLIQSLIQINLLSRRKFICGA